MKVSQEFLTLVLLGHGTTHSHTPGAPAPATLPHNKSPFEYLHTEEGFLHAKAYFSFIANNNNNDDDDETDEYFNENQFINFLRKLTDFTDQEILEIYDTFGEPPPQLQQRGPPPCLTALLHDRCATGQGQRDPLRGVLLHPFPLGLSRPLPADQVPVRTHATVHRCG